MRIIVLAFLSMWSCGMHAQDWALLNPAYRYNYSNDGTDTIRHQIRVMHVDTLGPDSLKYVLNTIGEACMSCTLVDPSTCSFPPAAGVVRSGRPQFLGWSAVVTQNSVTLQGLDTVTILLTGSVGSSWSFNDSLTAIVLSNALATPFGVADSIRTIGLSNGDVIILSKAHGLLSFPQTSPGGGDPYTLIGIEGLELGAQFPTITDIYNYQAGDILQYTGHEYATNGIGLNECFNKVKFTILARSDVGEHVEYTVRRVRRNICSGWWQTVIGEDTLYTNSAGCGLFAGNYMLDRSWPSAVALDTTACGPGMMTGALMQAKLDVNGRYVIEPWAPSEIWFLPHQLTMCTTDSLTLGFANDMDRYARWVEGIGMVHSNYSGFEWGGNSTLQGWFINGVLQGTITPDSILLSIDDWAVSDPVLVAPNPTTGTIRVQSQTPLTGPWRIVSTTGHLMREGAFHGGTSEWLDLSELPNGLYLLIGGTAVRHLHRIVIQH